MQERIFLSLSQRPFASLCSIVKSQPLPLIRARVKQTHIRIHTWHKEEGVKVIRVAGRRVQVQVSCACKKEKRKSNRRIYEWREIPRQTCVVLCYCLEERDFKSLLVYYTK